MRTGYFIKIKPKGYSEVLRPNKTAVHYTRTISTRKIKVYNHELATLSVRGTLDKLARTRYDIVKRYKMVEAGVFKVCYILKKNDSNKYVKNI